MRKGLKKVSLVSILAIWLAVFGCRDAAKTYPVEFVDRSAVFAPGRQPNPLLLVVEVTGDGKLSLNKIETGTIDDARLLAEKLEVVFDDREKTSINEREVVIDPQGEVKSEDLEKLIESLMGVKASPIRVIKNTTNQN